MTSFGANRFSGDDGGADPVVEAALALWAGVDPTTPDGRAARQGVIEALAASRVIVPIVAVGEESSSVEMRMAIVAARDGRSTLPVFTSFDSLKAWTPQARPVLTETQRAALSAVEEECQLIVVDPGGPVTFVVPRPAVWALAQGEPWLSPLDDDEVLAEVRSFMTAHPALRRLDAVPGREAEVAIEVEVLASAEQDEIDEALAALQRSIARSTTVANRVDSLELRVVRG